MSTASETVVLLQRDMPERKVKTC